ncbi:tyrosinase family oxidase copper chaperone [Streptomyces sp. NPDC006610]|uniref:tyrosinase family oxidase copper chaperone n=1 Tax=Streptomyces sp. NPDC006610 TaxID=3154584 RepID=UPI0033AEA124
MAVNAGEPRPRRNVMRGLLGSAAALALAPVVAASPPPEEALPEEPREVVVFEEVYRGRRIRGVRSLGDQEVRVTVDGRPLHLMRRADGGWLSTVDHYRSYPTPQEAARAAVDELGPGESLREPHDAGGGHRGVRP